MTRWNILYRGPLSSCNYACGYCPFAKTRNTAAELARDAEQLARFTSWVSGRKEGIGVLFTPWGEALIHRAYQRAIVEMSLLPNVHRVAIQTNLSSSLEWLADADLSTAALWATWHPTQTSMERFVERCRRLDELGARYSVGVVGLREAFADIEELRAILPRHVYLWVNAWKREPDYYREDEIRRIERVDPHFRLNTVRHRSLGRPCRAGSSAFVVDGDGQMRRCHFIPQVLGNIYESGFENALVPRDCTNETCGCHIGYVHLETLDLYTRFGEGVLERIPQDWPAQIDLPAMDSSRQSPA
jgi:MoaA/NifB/PqqE/SkfB family radical SAM enzyme